MKRNHLRYWIALGFISLICSGRGTAAAQTATDKTAADALYNDGKQLMLKASDMTDVAAACEKFKASVDRLAQIGAQYSLADCYKKIGKTASAWAMYRAAAAAATKANDRRQHVLEQAAADLEPRLSKLMIQLQTASTIAGLEIKRDGSAVPPDELGSPIPVDPGEHEIDVSVPGRAPWSTNVSIPPNPGVIELFVPMPEKLPAAPIARPIRRTAAYGIGGGGVVILDASLILGAVARTRWRDAAKRCPGGMCDAPGNALATSARKWGNASTITFAVGAAAVATGVFLFLTTPSVTTEQAHVAQANATRLVPDVGPAQAGLTLRGSF